MNESTQKRVIALGFFDGIHRGHGALLSRTVEVAREHGWLPTAFTFDRYPGDLYAEHTPLLSTPEDREGLARRYYGIQQVIVAPFTEEMMRMHWETFIEDFLVGQHGAAHLVAGHDFHFGYRGEGDPECLQRKCRELGIGCDIIPKVEYEGVTVSSTHIRSLIAGGKMQKAVEFLGHPHSYSNIVVHGKRLGSTIGVPTANLLFPEGLLVPAKGVYATRVLAKGRFYSAVTNVGVRPTVGENEQVSVEAWLLDFSGDLYGEPIRVDFYWYLRPEQKFDSLEDLKRQIQKDREETEAYFAQNPPRAHFEIP